MKKQLKIKFVVFDLGGVLIRITPERFYKQIWDKGDPPLSFIRGVQKRLQLGYERPEKILHELKEVYGLRMNLARTMHLFRTAYIGKKIVAMERLMKELLAKGYKLCLLSNTNQVHFNYIKPLFHQFKDFYRIYPSHRIHLVKPGKKIFRYMLQDLGAAPSEVLFIDDTKENIRSARSLGIRTFRIKMNKPDALAIRRFLEEEGRDRKTRFIK